MRLSKNFWLQELIKSSTAVRLGIPNEPNQLVLVSLTALVHNVLQPVRDEFGIITINSGYRSTDLNNKIGGSKRSQHCFGEAVDFEQLGTPNSVVAKWIANNLEFDQLILEFFNKEQPNSGWVHCSFKRDGANRQETKTAMRIKGKTVYKNGLLS